jgi:hypothetical protein
LLSNGRNRVRGSVLSLSQDGTSTNLFGNFRENSLKRDLSNATTANPPLFSLVNTFNMHCTHRLVCRKRMTKKRNTSINYSEKNRLKRGTVPLRKLLYSQYLFALGNVRPCPDLEHDDNDEDHGDEGAEDDANDKGHRPRHPAVVLLRRRRRRCRHLVTEHVVLVVVALDDALARRVVDGEDVPDVDLGGIVRENPGRI